MAFPSPLQLAQFRTQLKYFVEFDEEEWQLFSERLYLRKVAKKTLLVPAGKICNEVLFILSGAFRLYFVKDGVEITNYFCFKNEMVSSYSSFLKRMPSTINIEAMEDAEVICFTNKTMDELTADKATAFRFEQFRRRVAEYLIICYDERVMSFVTQSPEERYLKLLDDQPEFLQQVPQHLIANYLGITPVSLSRIRKRIFAGHPRKKMAS